MSDSENKLLELFEDFKIIVYVPFSDFNEYLERLETLTLNRIGDYKNCLSWTEVTSTWIPIDSANRKSLEKEVRLEFSCKKPDLTEIVKFMKLVHPYEEPEIDVIPIMVI